MSYKTENEILAVVRSFESGTIPRTDWRHREHLTVALFYILNTATFEEALDKMRGGIFNLLQAFEIDLSKDMPYHETLTVFWMRKVAEFAESKNNRSLVEICNELTENFDKDYPFKFYSRELLFADDARKLFVAPDLKPVNEKFQFDYKSATNQN